MSERFRVGERRRLVVASFLMLFTELALIRWVSAYQVHVAYFTNFVLCKYLRSARLPYVVPPRLAATRGLSSASRPALPLRTTHQATPSRTLKYAATITQSSEVIVEWATWAVS